MDKIISLNLETKDGELLTLDTTPEYGFFLSDGITTWRLTVSEVEKVTGWKPVQRIPPPLPWCFPIGSEQFPVDKWYIASKHREYNISIWSGGYHTGIDWNVEVLPRGDIDRGQPVFAIADGEIYATGTSDGWLSVIVIKIEYDRKPLWVRYGHLENDAIFKSWRPGLPITSGQRLGSLGDYKGGDHLHFDICKESFHPLTWWDKMSGATTEEKLARWVDPVSILKAHLDSALVDAALRIG